MTQYAKATEEQPSIKELLELSTRYHELITELADIFDVSFTPAMRERAFQVITDFADEMKMKTLASVVLSEVKRESK